MSDQSSTPRHDEGEPPLALRLAMLAASMETSIADTNCAVFVNGTPPMQTQIRWIREAVAALERTVVPSETTSITKERDEAIIKRDALHLVVSVLAGKLMLENAVLIDMLKQAEEELRAKRWLS